MRSEARADHEAFRSYIPWLTKQQGALTAHIENIRNQLAVTQQVRKLRCNVFMAPSHLRAPDPGIARRPGAVPPASFPARVLTIEDDATVDTTVDRWWPGEGQPV